MNPSQQGNSEAIWQQGSAFSQTPVEGKLPALVEASPLIQIQRIYHRVPKNLTGELLQPLNRLKEVLPGVYSQEVRKYEGRESLLLERIPGLDCLWNDVLQFSPVHPSLIRRALLDAGFPTEPMQWFEIDPSKHGFDASNSSVFLHRGKRGESPEQRAKDFAEFSPDSLSLLSELPEATTRYYSNSKQNGAIPLLFVGIPHVLFRGELKISDLHIIDA